MGSWRHNAVPVVVAAMVTFPGGAGAQDRGDRAPFETATEDIQQQLADSLAELTALREELAAEKVPLSRELSRLEGELLDAQLEYQKVTRLLDSRTLDLSNLRTDIKLRRDEAGYLSNLLNDYTRNFEVRLHIAELSRYEHVLEQAQLSTENGNLGEAEVFARQVALLTASLERLEDVLGGTRFQGTAVDPTGRIAEGTFAMIGPAALFRSADGKDVGTAEQRSLEPAVLAFARPADRAAAEQVVTAGRGLFPLDPTLGNAHVIESTHETFLEHVQKGGLVMIPIFALAGAAFLVALLKWLSMASLRTPSRRQVGALLAAVGQRDDEAVAARVGELRGPVGAMLQAGVEHRHEPRELIEEVMYEKVLGTRLRLQSFLPFIAICAASSPLLGLLGTVTGIISTFKLITVFGSGDVKVLSGGISEALITTEFGLIVAIPSLLIHAFLSRKAKGVVGQMETAAVSFLNEVSRAALPVDRIGGHGNGRRPATLSRTELTRAAIAGPSPVAEPDPELVRGQVREALAELLSPRPRERDAEAS